MTTTADASTAVPASPVADPVPPDERTIVDMPFAGGRTIVDMLVECGCRVARDIETLGCTGAYYYGLKIDDIATLRLGLAGGGVGLPCFVPPTRFCLAHNTIGGLQADQQQYYAEAMDSISRALTPKEAGRVAFTESVRREARANVGEQMMAAQRALSGYGEPPHGVEMIDETEAVPRPVLSDGVIAVPSLAVWRCPEHTALNWSCRYCVAQAIVEGELTPEFVLHQPENPNSSDSSALGAAAFGLSGPELVDSIMQLDAAGAQEIEVYVLAKTLTRKLA